MTQGKDDTHFEFDHYQPKISKKNGFVVNIIGLSIAHMIRKPLISTVLFMLVGAGIAGAIIASYPSEVEMDTVPIIKADTHAYKQSPNKAGGMKVEGRNSTIYASMDDQELKESAPVENLIKDKEALNSFSKQVEEAVQEDRLQERREALIEMQKEARKKEKKLENLLQAQKDADRTAKKDVEKIASAPVKASSSSNGGEPPRIPLKHGAGANPETLEFVRSVLNKQEEEKVASSDANIAHSMASIEPAAGATTAAKVIKPGTYYVQLASVSKRNGTEREWGKLLEAFPQQLNGLKYRVSTADLGSRGVFYRIQAGPMAKASADRICAQIKAQKPGGCLVTR
ncbi:MAG: hypothetical protein CBB87_02785 [Micavibrio sp. TMED27]|nr:hypothetical protein [Micavibrio sp.]OUT92249.1 MAG: hypothetical protein CBB87_02785 [Micavibrio sp. TMED27]|tara:strand:+ start:11920 stop:12945 length:1026 start_codon:yes stop_codon:yes gene_type:complete